MSGYHGNKQASTKRMQVESEPTVETVHLEFSLEQLKDMLRSGVHSLCTAAGLTVLYKMMDEDVTALAGPKGKHDPNRVGYRHGTEGTSVVLSGQRVAIQRPRVRSKNGTGELPIETYEIAKNDDLLLEVALARMLHGLSSRNYLKGQEALPEDTKRHGSAKSTVSRRFTQATQAEFKRLMSRRLDSLNISVLLLDGVEFAETTVVVAMGIDETGAKHVLGMRLGATENAAVCKDLLADLVERGLDAEDGLLAIIDGAKALRSALKTVYGERVLVQRCRVHKKRNVLDYLPKEQRPWVKRQLTKAWAMTDADEAIRSLKGLATHLETHHPDAAGSLREGLEETVTVMQLGVSGLLQKSLSTTNAIESAFDTVRTHARNVKRWRNGNMIQRWTAAGLLAAEERFRRIKGYKEMQALRTAIRRQTVEKAPEGENERKTA
jgi:putative transposase